MPVAVSLILSLSLALVLAALSCWFVLRRGGKWIHNGPWRTNLSTGGERAGLYHRARIAVYALWPMRSSESVYFIAECDSTGQALRQSRTYRLEGRDPEARWWSLSAYVNRHLIQNPENRYSFSKTTVRRNSDGGWTIYLSPRTQQENWLPSGDKEGHLSLILRCYNPSPMLIHEPGVALLPRIVPESSP